MEFVKIKFIFVWKMKINKKSFLKFALVKPLPHLRIERNPG